MENIKEIIAKNIKSFREFRGYSQEKLSLLTNVPLETIIGIEKGEVDIDVNTINILARRLKAELSYIFMDNSEFQIKYEKNLAAQLNAMESIEENSESPLRRKLLWGFIKQDLTIMQLEKFDLPMFSVSNTSKEQRKELVQNMLFNQKYSKVAGYIEGENEIRDIIDEVYLYADEFRNEHTKERESKANTDIWILYKEILEQLDNAVNRAFSDMRYAELAVQKVGEYIQNSDDKSLSAKVLATVADEIDDAAKTSDISRIKRIMEYLINSSSVIWEEIGR